MFRLLSRIHGVALAQVRLRDGQDLLTLIRTEIQGPNDTLWPARKHPSQEQFVRKKALIRHLYNWGFEHEQIMQLFNILDAMLILPESMEQDFVEAVSHAKSKQSTLIRICRCQTASS